MTKVFDTRKLFAPLFFSVAYILGTFLCSVCIPVRFVHHEYRYFSVLAFLLGVIVCMAIGYYVAIKTAPRKRDISSENIVDRREQNLLLTMIVLSMFSLGLEFIFLLSVGHFSLNPSEFTELYVKKIHSESSLVYLIRFLCSPFRVGSICIGFYRFNKNGLVLKCLSLINMTFYVLIYLCGYGIQKEVGSVVIIMVVCLCAHMFRSGTNSFRILSIIIFILLAAFIGLAAMQYSRLSSWGYSIYTYKTPDTELITDDLFFSVFGEKAGLGMVSILSPYLSQGYYGLSLCLQLPFVWSYGVGGSHALTQILGKIGFSGVYERTYLSRMEYTFGRSGLHQWNTIFPWLASDLTWTGAMVFMGAVGFIMARSWREVIENDNVISLIVLFLCAVLVLFIPANNQLFHGYDTIISTYFWLLFWVVFGKRYMY